MKKRVIALAALFVLLLAGCGSPNSKRPATDDFALEPNIASQIMFGVYDLCAPDGAPTELGTLVSESTYRSIYENDGFNFDTGHPVFAAYMELAADTMESSYTQIATHAKKLGYVQQEGTHTYVLPNTDHIELRLVGDADAKGLYFSHSTIIPFEDFPTALNYAAIAKHFNKAIGLVVDPTVLEEMAVQVEARMSEPGSLHYLCSNFEEYSALCCYVHGDADSGSYAVEFLFHTDYIGSRYKGVLQ